nr:alkyl/aryl-sulfatase BDS1 [Salmonella sp. NCTC 7297]
MVRWQSATLDELPPEEAAKKFVEYMGGADAILQKAKADFDQGNYRWVAQVVSKVVFADPNNQNARNLKPMRWNNWGIRLNLVHGVTST